MIVGFGSSRQFLNTGENPTSANLALRLAKTPSSHNAFLGPGASKSTLVAPFVDRYAPHRVCSAVAVWYPLIDSIKALRPNVARQDPQKSVSKS